MTVPSMNNKESHKMAYQERKFLEKLWDQDQAVVLYENNRLARVNFAFAISLIMSILTNFFVLSMSRATLMVEFSSLLSARIWQIIFLVLGNMLLYLILRYRNTYITKVELKPYKQVVITTWNIGKRKTWVHDVLEFKNAVHHQGEFTFPEKPMVHAPYIKLEIVNGKTYLLDMQGNFPMGYPAIHKVFNA